MKTLRQDVPQLGLGLGLRGTHLAHIREYQPDVGFFELLSENYLHGSVAMQKVIAEMSERYPLVLHGVSLSIGSTDPLDFEYLAKLKHLACQLDAPWVSDHVCWTGVLGQNTHDLLPMPYTEESLNNMVERVRIVSDFIERPFLLENPSSYVTFSTSSMSEAEFLARLVDASGCGLLLDVNNIYVTAQNHGYDAFAYLEALPLDSVVQVHLAGHTHKGSHLLDTHSDHVKDEVWALYHKLVKQTGYVSTMVEWDEDIPEFRVVFDEVQKAKRYLPSEGVLSHVG